MVDEIPTLRHQFQMANFNKQADSRTSLTDSDNDPDTRRFMIWTIEIKLMFCRVFFVQLSLY